MTEGVLDPVMIITVPASTSFPVLHPRSKESKIPRGESKFPNTGALTWEFHGARAAFQTRTSCTGHQTERRRQSKGETYTCIYIYFMTTATTNATREMLFKHEHFRWVPYSAYWFRQGIAFAHVVSSASSIYTPPLPSPKIKSLKWS